MITTLVMVSSANGLITRGKENSHAWASPEDQQKFLQIRDKHNLILMGRKTYEDSRQFMTHAPGRKRIVLTHQPERFQDQVIPDQLEFTNEDLPRLMKRLESEGFREALLVGGGETATAFLATQLVNYFIHTVEPVIFPTGIPLFAPMEGLQFYFHLEEQLQLNERGTVQYKYAVQYK